MELALILMTVTFPPMILGGFILLLVDERQRERRYAEMNASRRANR